MQGVARVLCWLACLLLPTLVSADTLITVEVEAPGRTLSLHSGQEQKGAPKKESRIWLGEDRARYDDLRKSVILRRDLGKVYYVDHSRRSYVEAELPARLETLVPPELAEKIAGGALEKRATVTFTASDERKAFGSWNCRRYEAVIDGAGLHVTRTLWLSSEIGVDRELLADLLRAAALSQPLAGAVLEKIADTGAVPVVEENRLQAGGVSVVSRREVKSVRTVTPGPDTYSPPADYKKVDYLYRTLHELGLR
ncbi:MAG: hypothetical protein D6718_05200 [Acidobacteria bacterium]|nr:MAG: hypothetical protein D6718_05200 [Acidobacteriota bacterium]